MEPPPPDISHTVDGSFPPVRIITGVAFELIAQLAAFTSGPARASLESGKTWIRDVRRLAGPELITRVQRYSLGLYVELATLGLEAPPPRDVDDLLETVRGRDAGALRARVLGADSALNRTMVGDGVLERALDGEPAARAEVRAAFGTDADARRAVERLLVTRPDVVKAELLGILEEWSTRVLPRDAGDALAAIERDRQAKELLARTGPGSAVITAATNGVEYRPSPWIEDIVLVPTVAMRPFVVPTELGPSALFVYSVADEAFDADPQAPPRRLVKIAAAMGDPTRMRILHLLRTETHGAAEIADRLGLERTSLYHHLGILRSAGLLVIRDEGERGWRYRLRDGAWERLTSDLGAYLGDGRPPSSNPISRGTRGAGRRSRTSRR